MRPELLIFDLDDTLVDWSERSRHAKQAVAEFLSAQVGHTVEEWLTEIYAPDGGLWQQVTRGELPHSDLEAARMRRLLATRSRHDDELVVQACRTYRSAMTGRAQVDQQVLQLLEELREQHRVYLLTNGLADFQWLTLKGLGLESYFDQILICSDLRAYKPDRAAFDAVLRHANCEPEQAWMIGDSWTDDIVPALELGMTTVWINPQRRAFPDERRPHFDLASVVELAEILI